MIFAALFFVSHAAPADDAFCEALARRDVVAIRSFVVGGMWGSAPCSAEQLGLPEPSSGSGNTVGRALGVIATGGLLAPFAGGKGGRGWYTGVDIAIAERRADLLAALSAGGDLQEVQSCFEKGLDQRHLVQAAFCAAALHPPQLYALHGDHGSPDRLEVMVDAGAQIHIREHQVPFLTWGPQWGANPGMVGTLIELGLPLAELQRTVDAALSTGELGGLGHLRDHFDVTLEVGALASDPWLHAPAVWAQARELGLDFSKASHTWHPKQDAAFLRNPRSMGAMLDLGVPLDFFEGACGAALRAGQFSTCKALARAGVPNSARLGLADIANPAVREAVEAQGIDVSSSTLGVADWSAPGAGEALEDDAVVSFLATQRIPACGAAPYAREHGLLGRLSGLDLSNCDAKGAAALLGHPDTAKRLVIDANTPQHTLMVLAVTALAADDLPMLARLVPLQPTTSPELTLAVEHAIRDTRWSTVNAGLPMLENAVDVVAAHRAAFAHHGDPNVLAALALPPWASDPLFIEALEAGRMDVAAAVGSSDTNTAVRAVMAHEGTPEAMRGALKARKVLYDAYPMRWAVGRGDTAMVAVLCDADVYASLVDVMSAITAGFNPDLVARMVGTGMRPRHLRKLRRRAVAQGWPPADLWPFASE